MLHSHANKAKEREREREREREYFGKKWKTIVTSAFSFGVLQSNDTQSNLTVSAGPEMVGSEKMLLVWF